MNLEALLRRLANAQTQRPFRVLLLVLVSLAPAGWLASHLTLRTGQSELLPDDKPSVIEFRRISEKLVGVNTLAIAAESNDEQLLRRFVDEVTPELRRLPPDLVGAVDDGTRATRAFFEQYKALYADTADLESLHDDVMARYDYEVGKQAGTNLDLEDDEIPPPITARSLSERFAKKQAEAEKKQAGVDGYYLGEEGHFVALLVRTPLSSSRAEQLEHEVSRIIDAHRYTDIDPQFRYAFTGNLITGAEQERVVKRDLLDVGITGVGLVLGITFLFFLRVRTLFAIGLTILVGCTWAFGAAYLSVGYLNLATGFLASIIAGNGINFSILFMARYMEARRDEALSVPDAIQVAHRDTHAGTLAAAGAAMIAYGSLSLTDFRGFRHFGVIGGVGMILCWIATYVTLPAVLVLVERPAPMFQGQSWRDRFGGVYGRPFAWLAQRAPGGVAIVALVLGAASAWVTVRYFREDPMEYDLAKVAKNDDPSPTNASVLSRRVGKVVGRAGQDGKAILCDRVDQVAPLVAELERRRDSAVGVRPFQNVVSILSLLPKDQDRKLELLTELLDRIERAKKRGFLSSADYTEVRRHLPPKLEPVGIADLPEQVARPFTERDGTRGRIVYIVPSDGESVYDAKYLMRWADTFREVTLPNGELIRGTGDSVLYSDMLINIGEDAPKAIVMSLVGTILVILLSFRGRASGFIALGCLVLGVLYLTGSLAFQGHFLGRDWHPIKLNFLNFVALPISIGVGADYAINVMKRRDIEGDAALYRVVTETGGAVVLCSLTTFLGYFALLFSINRGVRSFGLAASLGEATTLLAAMLVMPSLLFWLSQRRAKRSQS